MGESIMDKVAFGTVVWVVALLFLALAICIPYSIYHEMTRDHTKIELYADEWLCTKSRIVQQLRGKILVNVEKCLVWERKGM